VRFGRGPLGFDDASEDAAHRYDDDHGEQQVASQDPPAPEEDVRDDHERERKRTQEDGTPEVRRPPQDGLECLGDLLIEIGRRASDDRCQAGEDRGSCDEYCVDRAPVPPPRLGRRQQGEVPYAVSRHGVLVSARGRGRQDDTGPAPAS
jgi:hypothetical protein